MSGRLCVLSIVVALFAPGLPRASEPARNWIEREGIRAGWIYHRDGIEQIDRFKRQGLNALVTSAAKPDEFDLWTRESRRVGMHLFGVLGFSFDAEKAGLRRAVFGNGYQSVVACPCDAAFWQRQMIDRAVALARQGMTAEREISGILIDFELYANSGKGGQIYYTDACYCDHCIGSFLAQEKRSQDAAKIPFADRVAWLKQEKLFDAYHPFLQGLVREQAQRMREAVEKVRPDFFVGFYPRPHNWMLLGVAQGISSPEHPMILWATDTYGGGGPGRVPDWREEMSRHGISCYYCGGMLLRFYSAANLATNMVRIARLGNGYWLFTLHTLCIPEDRQSGDYYLAAGTPDEYLAAIRRANQELDRCAADRACKPSLEFVAEPVRYRNVGYDVARLKVPKLGSGDSSPRGQLAAVPPVSLSGGQFLAASLAKAEPARVDVEAAKTAGGDPWGVSYAVLDPAKTVLASGRIAPGEQTTIAWQAAQPGVHTLVLTAGYYARAKVLRSTIPLALLIEDKLEVTGPGGTFGFEVPAGLDEFRLSAGCQWGTKGVSIAIRDPLGNVVVERPTDPFERTLELTVPVQGKPAGPWTLEVRPLPKTSFRTVMIRLDKRIPQHLTLAP